MLDQLIENGSSGSSYEIAMSIRPLIAPDCLGVDTVPAAHSPGRERGLEGMAVVRGCSGARHAHKLTGLGGRSGPGSHLPDCALNAPANQWARPTTGARPTRCPDASRLDISW